MPPSSAWKENPKQCRFCSKIYQNIAAKISHEKHCKKGPKIYQKKSSAKNAVTQATAGAAKNVEPKAAGDGEGGRREVISENVDEREGGDGHDEVFQHAGVGDGRPGVSPGSGSRPRAKDHVGVITRRKSAASQSEDSSEPDREAPGQDGEAPGQDGEAHGQDGEAPGQDGEPPGQDGEPPGSGETTRGREDTDGSKTSEDRSVTETETSKTTGVKTTGVVTRRSSASTNTENSKSTGVVTRRNSAATETETSKTTGVVTRRNSAATETETSKTTGVVTRRNSAAKDTEASKTAGVVTRRNSTATDKERGLRVDVRDGEGGGPSDVQEGGETATEVGVRRGVGRGAGRGGGPAGAGVRRGQTRGRGIHTDGQDGGETATVTAWMCIFCSRVLTNKAGLASHQRTCKLNPIVTNPSNPSAMTGPDLEEEATTLELQLQGGVLGFKNARGFHEVTNFSMEVLAQICSQRYKIKGHIWTIKFQKGTEFKVFIPKQARCDPEKFEFWLDLQLIDQNILLDSPRKPWKDCVLKKLKLFGEGKTMWFVEYIGKQIHTWRDFPTNKSMWRYCYGPDLFFLNDGTVDNEPVHFWFEHLKTAACRNVESPPILVPLKFEIDPSHSLEKFIQAATPGNFWSCMSVAGGVLNGANTEEIRKHTDIHQTSSTVVMGPKSSGKTSWLEAIMVALLGMEKQDKLDPSTALSTIKEYASTRTIPTFIEDNESMWKEGALVAATFDQTKFLTKKKETQMQSVFVFSTNVEIRVERSSDRQTITKMKVFDHLDTELKRRSLENYTKCVTAKLQPVGATMIYGEYVRSPDWKDKVDEFTAVFESCFGVKERTARSYAMTATAVNWMYDRHPEVFESLGHPISEYFEDFIPNTWAATARLAHIERSHAPQIWASYVKGIRILVREWSVEDRKRNLALAQSTKEKIPSENVLAIRESQEKFKNVLGISMETVKKLAVDVGALHSINCTKFVPDEGSASTQHKSLIYPLNKLSSPDLLEFCDLLEDDNYRFLADTETPTIPGSQLDNPSSQPVLASNDQEDGHSEEDGNKERPSEIQSDGEIDDSISLSLLYPLEQISSPYLAQFLESFPPDAMDTTCHQPEGTIDVQGGEKDSTLVLNSTVNSSGKTVAPILDISEITPSRKGLKPMDLVKTRDLAKDDNARDPVKSSLSSTKDSTFDTLLDNTRQHYQCPKCGKPYQLYGRFKIHVDKCKVETTKVKNVIPCPKPNCTFLCTTMAGLSKHQKSDKCGKSKISQTLGNVEMSMEKPQYQNRTTSGSFTKEMTSNSGEKNKCQEQDKDVEGEKNKSREQNNDETGGKKKSPEQDNDASRSTSRLPELKQCNYCSKSFKSAGALGSHKRACQKRHMTEEKEDTTNDDPKDDPKQTSLVCGDCGDIFKSTSGLKLHSMNHKK